ncbi:peptidase S8/S53 domain-containing protein [Pterulicium gracile]|uniref:Peptidase S8/S53 domain-containing protein n=1 Tax=Pterulicium gracile TaxID=1884261 RepID=A0A5C3QLS6_9AGAR|nr:peptidase S8/S53 domain-containing protein [Pterula gracilis]
MSTSLVRWSVAALSVTALAAASPLSTSTQHTTPRSQWSIAPLVVNEHPHGTVNDSYIVMFRDDVPVHLVDNHFNFLQSAHEASPLLVDASGVTHVYSGHINGYAGRFSNKVIDQLRSLPEVDYIERDQIVRTTSVQNGAPWGLARVSHRKKLSFGTFRKYEYDSNGGEGVDVYVVDTGINIDHEEFEGRASWGKTIPQNDQDIDGNGHGTHCAGTIASRKYGVAKKANVIAVKVLGTNGSGTMSDVVAGVAYAAEAAGKKKKIAEAEFAATGKSSHKGSVANMSLGGGKSPALDKTVNKAVESGLHFAVAAGNDNKDACNYSPAAAEKAVTVGASTLFDERAYFSNFGSCVDVFGPGLNILSTWIGSKNAVNTISGTSMASPHTAGMLAYLLSIYPSVTFDPETKELVPNPLYKQAVFANPVKAAYNMARSTLPTWIANVLPPLEYFGVKEQTVSYAPHTMSPSQLKEALLGLSTKGALSELPVDTVNLLIFNNATNSSSFA